MVTVAITGHRPEIISDFGWVREQLTDVLQNLSVSKLYQGMAAGVDLLSAEVAFELNIPYVACRPWAGHSSRVADRTRYQTVLDNASEIVDVNPASEYVGVWVYHNRNKFMVDAADVLVAVWNGSLTGGTAACVKYAKQKRKPMVQINPLTRIVVSDLDLMLF